MPIHLKKCICGVTVTDVGRAFSLILKAFSRLEFRALCRPLEPLPTILITLLGEIKKTLLKCFCFLLNYLHPIQANICISFGNIMEMCNKFS